MRNASGTPLGGMSYRPVQLGGLGFCSGMSIAADGSWMLVKTDVGGAYRRASGSTTWTQVCETGTPAVEIDATGKGSYAVAIAPSNANVAYMVFRGKVLKTTDKGLNWTETGFVGKVLNSNLQPDVRLMSETLVIDPVNADVVYLGTPFDGLYRTLDGGTNWSSIATVPTPSAASGYENLLIAVDASSATTSGRKSVVYASSYGNGVYRSSDGGDTFSSISGTYTSITDLAVSSTGVLWIPDRSLSEDNIHRYTHGVGWATMTSTPANYSARYITFDPSDANHIILSNMGKHCRSLDGGTTWVGAWQPAYQRATATNVPTIAQVMNYLFTNLADASHAKPRVHPSDGKVYQPMGLGVCHFVAADWPLSLDVNNKLNWIEDSLGIEELVAHSAYIMPDGSILCSSQDKGIIRSTDPATYAAAVGMTSALTNGAVSDSAIDDPLYAATLIHKGTNYSGYTEDGGVTWTQFTGNYNATRTMGSLAVSNAGNVVVCPGSNSHPKYTTDNGVNWAACDFGGNTLPAEGTSNGFGFGSFETRRHIVTADKANPGTFYVYNYGEGGSNNLRGLWKSTNGGANFTRQNSTSILNALYVGYHAVLRHWQGRLYLIAGPTGNDWVTEATDAYFYVSDDDGVTWSTLANVTEPQYFDLGAPATGSAYPTIWYLGWYNHTYGLWFSIDNGASFNASDANVTFDNPYSLCADRNTFGRVVVGYSGTGFIEGRYDYRLRAS